MNIDLMRSAEQFHKRHRRNRMFRRLVSILGCLVVFWTTYAMILPAITLERETVCGLAEHQHEESCHTLQTVRHLTCAAQSIGVHTHTAQCADGSCGYADFVLHSHDASCRDGSGVLVCALPEVTAHTHSDGCYRIPTWEESGHTHTEQCYGPARGALICGREETEGHTHTDSCKGQVPVLCCDLPETDGHTHAEGCYNENRELTCTLAETKGHHHAAACYRTEEKLTCGKEACEPHHHTDACYEWVNALVCGEKEGPILRQGTPELICGRQQRQPHRHTAACFAADGAWICGQPEILSHTHTDACFTCAEEDVLTCGLEEHAHGEQCWPNEETTEATDAAFEPDQTQETEQQEPTEEEIVVRAGGGVYSFTVSKPGWTARMKAFARMRMATYVDSNGTGGAAMALDPYVSSVSVEKLVNNQWVSSERFTDGDNIKVYISYSITENVVGPDSRTVTYQVPANVRPIQEESGRVSIGEGASAQEVGDYTITTDGRITIVFDEAFANNEAFTGNIYFLGQIDAGADGQGGTITFPGTSDQIVIEKKQEESGNAHDISVQKTGRLNEDGSVSYTVEVSTQNGTKDGQTITIGDFFESSGAVVGAYQEDTLIVKKIASNGAETTLTAQENYALNFGTQNGQANFAITGLGELEAGEKYVVTYTAAAQSENADGSAVLKNHGYAQTEDYSDQSHQWVDTEISKSWIRKNGWNDTENNVIKWEITVNPYGNDLAGWTLTDILKTGDETVDLSQVEFSIKDGEGQTLKDANGQDVTSLPIVFPAGTENRKTYTIQYSTPTGSFDDGTVLSNTASLTDGERTYQDVQDVQVKLRDWKLSKASSGGASDVSDGVRQYLWNVNVTLPGGPLSSFTYVDTLQNPVSSTGETRTGMHYAIASQIEAALRSENGLRLELEDGTVGYPTGEDDDVVITVTYYADADRTVCVEADNTQQHITSFAITVASKEETSVSGAKKLWIGSYPTFADHTDMDIGETWTLRNTGQVDGLTSTAETSYTKPKPLEKYVYRKDQSGTYGYSADSAQLQYDDLGGKIQYRLLWRNLDGTNDAVVITDILPAGMRLSGEVSAGFYGNDSFTWYQKQNYTTGEVYDLSSSEKPVSSAAANEDGTTTLTITIPAGHNLDGNNHPIVIFYEVEFDWPSLARDSVLFTNRASFDGYETAQNTTVKRNVPIVSKSGRQLTTVVNAEEKPLDTVEYTVVINPAAKDLNPGADTLLLTDALTVNDGVQAYLDMDQVALYDYDDAASNKCGTPISTQRYQLSLDQQNHSFTVRLPDELACVLVYRYVIDEGNAASVSLSNTAGLNGETTEANRVQFSLTNSGATAFKRGKVIVRKVDSEDFTKGLPGAVFQVDWYHPESTAEDKWQPVVKSESDDDKNLSDDGKYTTDSTGEILFFKNHGTALPVGKLIRLVETASPTGYKKDSTERYFVIYRNDQSLNTAKEAIRETIAASGISEDVIAFYKTGTDVTIYVPNESTSVQVQKIWLDEHNHQITSGIPESIEVQLYSQPMVQQYYTVTVQSVWRSVAGGYYARDPVVIQVDHGSPLTICVATNEQTDNQTYTVSVDNGQARAMTFREGKYTYTFEQISGNMYVEVTNYTNGAPMDFTLSGYRGPVWVAGEGRTAIGEPVTLHSGNDWSYKWTDLQQTEEEIYYVVEEVNVPSGYTVSYTNNGIKKGEITVSNKRIAAAYTLPETGGAGTGGYTLGGFTLTLGAALWLLRRRKRGREDF